MSVDLLYRSGYLTPATVRYVLLALFPTYLVLIAALFSKWLGSTGMARRYSRCTGAGQ